MGLPASAAPALLRDRRLRALLQPVGLQGEALARPEDLAAVRARLGALGFAVEDAPGLAGDWATMTDPEDR